MPKYRYSVTARNKRLNIVVAQGLAKSKGEAERKKRRFLRERGLLKVDKVTIRKRK